MFEKPKAEKEGKEHQEALEHWTALRDGYAPMVEIARPFPAVGACTDRGSAPGRTIRRYRSPPSLTFPI
jgi:hypothetical protein